MVEDSLSLFLFENLTLFKIVMSSQPFLVVLDVPSFFSLHKELLSKLDDRFDFNLIR